MSISDQRCHSLFFSAHLDDVVLSCALRLLKERREGKKVVVATVCSHALPLLPGLDLYKGRQHEDKQALNVLDVSNPLWLGFRDAPFRNLFYTSFKSIVLGKHQQDDNYMQAISEKAKMLCQELAPKTVFLPLAVGTHIDHRLTHQLWCALPSDTNIIFYEDRPYVFLPHSLTLRLKEIQVVTSPELPESSDNNHDILKTFAKGLTDMVMYKNVLKWKKDRFHYLLWAARKIKLPPQASGLKIEAEVIKTNSVDEVKQVEKAIWAYKSQLALLYKSQDILRQESTLYTHSFDTNCLYAERYWKLVR